MAVPPTPPPSRPPDPDARRTAALRPRPPRLATVASAVAGFLAGLGIGFIGNIMTGQPAWYLAALAGVPVGIAYARGSGTGAPRRSS